MQAIPGCPRVEGDEEEDDTDDLENEFDIAQAMLSARLNVGRGSQATVFTPSELDSASVAADIPLLTYGDHEVKF
jgi:cellulose synthase A